MSHPPRISAVDLARALGQEHPPTDEQREIIEAPLEPLLVVAGAGSGKTETMTARVVWLVANDLVTPEQVLGLTFTRKAAGELAERVGRRLATLESAGVWSPPQEPDADGLGGTPTISTYHAYAGRLVREGALRLGYEKDSRLLSEAATWQLAHEVVVAWDGPMADIDKTESTVTNAVVSLAGELAEHLRSPAEVDDFARRTLAHLEGVAAAGKDFTKDFRGKVMTPMAQQRLVLPIVERYREVKRERSVMDFSDQMARAAALATRFPDLGQAERDRFRVVLLDEFQDTSEAQLVLMRELFAPAGQAPAAVTAVGDPHQSIYAWRGASATTLATFPRSFATAGEAAPVKHLSTSWRNDESILAVANAVAGPLGAVSGVPVTPLRPRPGAGQGQVQALRVETAHDEAAQVAEWIATRRGDGRRTAAVLCRKRSQFTLVAEALAARNIPHEVVGLGGLLLTPEVADVISLLTVVQDPSRGDRLMRLLTGPPGLLGPADLDGLGTWARHLAREARAELGDDAPPPGPDDTVTIVDALDRLPEPGWTGDGGQTISGSALRRLQHIGAMVARLRRQAGVPLPDLVGEAERELGVDVEVLARPGWSPGAARAHLDAFADVAAQFASSADRPTLGGFIDWIEAAVEQERGLEKPVVEPTKDAVQILTCHAAKGLEWDVVAVPGLTEGVFPTHLSRASLKDGQWVVGQVNDSGWITGLDGVPFPLRGDREGLPHLDLSLAETKPLQEELGRYRADNGEHGLLEERRLAYVAFTRARSQLLLGSWVWGATGQQPRLQSRFLDEALAAGPVEVLGWADMPETKEATNPALEVGRQVVWPGGEPAPERPVLEAAAAAMAARAGTAGGDGAAGAVAADGAGGGGDAGAEPDEIDATMRLLLREREQRRRARDEDVEVELPAHLSTSQLVSLARDAGAFALDLRRPMPQPPQVAGRRGTAFHAWVEQHYADAGLVDLLEMPGSADESLGDADLATMQEHFLASEWAERVPLEVELSLETVIGEHAVRGRVDAVFADDDGGVTVVDWKTGRPPRGDEAQVRAVQLSAYRIAYARWRGLDPARVRGAFFHAATGETTRPRLLDEDEVVRLLGEVVA
ncbi:ATP-dependent helicase [Janibacter indicus]|uniref:DNA 3'-5' helicase n=1 Tax=Janibacter indicus TaxID=857417 RepID=A0A1W1ZCA7_9MICO|nr:ATP-dependent DNA helicase [Janibacter indicus]SMC46059.1 DNA helicase-2 / ATP-dependent DNA helicase PcrA [Janibacter indicus]